MVTLKETLYKKKFSPQELKLIATSLSSHSFKPLVNIKPLNCSKEDFTFDRWLGGANCCAFWYLYGKGTVSQTHFTKDLITISAISTFNKEVFILINLPVSDCQIGEYNPTTNETLISWNINPQPINKAIKIGGTIAFPIKGDLTL